MRFHVITIFPKIFDSYIGESLFKRAAEKKIVSVRAYNMRDYSTDRHKKVDDRPFGGGPGMVMKVEPIYKAVQAILKKINPKNSPKKNSARRTVRTILFSTRGKKLDPTVAKRLATYDDLIMICGRYEGVDERVAEHIADEEISIGDYVLSGGELPALVVMEAVSRFVPGFLGKEESLEEVNGSFKTFTRPEIFLPGVKAQKKEQRQQQKKGLKSISRSKQAKKKKLGKGWRVPEVLLSGDHKKVKAWREQKGFTLIELLVVIAIIAILSIVVVLTLNPATLLQQSRDANRISDWDYRRLHREPAIFVPQPVPIEAITELVGFRSILRPLLLDHHR